MATAPERFAGCAASLSEAPLPADALHHARRCVLDWFAVAIPGGVEPPAALLTQAFAEELDRGGARLVPSGRRATARLAALINGAASDTLQFADYFRYAIHHTRLVEGHAALSLSKTPTRRRHS